MDKCSKISHFSFSLLKLSVSNQHQNLQNACQNSKQSRPGSDCFFRSSLTWFYPVCLSLFGRQPLFKILEHLLFQNLLQNEGRQPLQTNNTQLHLQAPIEITVKDQSDS